MPLPANRCKTGLLLAPALLLALTACQQQGPRVHMRPTPETIEGVRNVTRDGDLYVTGSLTDHGLETMRARGVKTVVDLRLPEQVPTDYPARVRALGMKYVHAPMESNAMTSEVADNALDALEHSATGPVVLQCGSANRSGAIYGAYLCRSKNTTATEAMKLAREAGLRNDELAADLEKYLTTGVRP